MPDTNLFAIASVHADWVTARQSAVASNIANAKVPGYRPVDTVSFQEYLAETSSETAAAGEPSLPEMIELEGRVALESELMRSAQVRSAYGLNTASVSAFHNLFMTVAKG